MARQADGAAVTEAERAAYVARLRAIALSHRDIAVSRREAAAASAAVGHANGARIATERAEEHEESEAACLAGAEALEAQARRPPRSKR